MNLNLSWDLFILVFFGVIIAYSFIIGRNQTLKVITGTYVAILCSDALGNLFARYFVSSDQFLKILSLFSIGDADQAVAFFKVLMLITLVVMIAVRGTFDYDAEDDKPMPMRMGMNFVLGLMSAGLMMSAMLIFVSGGSLIVDAALVNNPLTEIYTNSRFVRIMVDYSNFWFFIPGLSLVFVSFFSKK